MFPPVRAEVAEVEDIRTFEFEEFVDHGKKRGHDEVEEDIFPLTKILKIPITKIQEEAQIRKKWLKWWNERMVTC